MEAPTAKQKGEVEEGNGIMGLFVVDQEKCKRDGVCVAECPIGIIELRSKDDVPTPTEDAENFCIDCGHCVTVCPHGALSHRSMTPERCPPVRREWALDPERVEHFLRTRRSIRSYRAEPVDREVLIKLIDIARYAPSGHNSQPVRWLIIYDGAEVRRLAGFVAEWLRFMVEEQPEVVLPMHMDRVVAAWDSGDERICRGAPHIIVAQGKEGERAASDACIIALAHLELAAPAFGLGACWAGYFNRASTLWPPMRKTLGLPKGYVSYGAMMVGYPKYAYQRLPLRNEARITWR
jgi:nitroreductase/ferredoxin